MKQVLQSLKTGTTEVADVPSPGVSDGQVLIKTSRTLISAGTERMLVDFGRASLLGKARQQPERVRMVVDKIRTDGLGPTLSAVRNKLDQPLSLGYSNAGIVLRVGSGVTAFEPGDRVVSNGNHAEVVSVPSNLVVRIPDPVSDDEAAFTVLGAIGLQGLRLAAPTLGEAVVVTGLGLIGLIAVQLLRAQGCRVLGIDFDTARLQKARDLGVETVDLGGGQDPLEAATVFSRGRGVDCVLVTAATKSDEPIRQAAQMCRQRGRIVLVGVSGLNLSRDEFFRKELSFQVSCSYGPGRYDPEYEERGRDYPVGHVRWTAQRNFEAVLDMMAEGHLAVANLVSHRFEIGDAAAAYDVVSGGEPSLGILLDYPGADAAVGARAVQLGSSGTHEPTARPAVGFIGSGNYATAVLMPAFREAGARLASVVSKRGVTSLHAGRKFGFERASTDWEEPVKAPDIDAVVVATRHDSHASLAMEALRHGKDVFVEKPLCLTLDELSEIEAVYRAAVEAGHAPRLMVGFNRRFAPHVVTAKALVSGVSGPKAAVMTVNAGMLPPDHWAQHPLTGGGRVLGEACHHVELLRHLIGVPIAGHHITYMRAATDDTASIQLAFEDGSIGTVHYFANGSRSFPKERLEIFASGRVLHLDNFRRMTGHGWPGFKSSKLRKQDKGHAACVAAFVRALEEGTGAPIPIDEIFEVTRVTIQLTQGKGSRD